MPEGLAGWDALSLTNALATALLLLTAAWLWRDTQATAFNRSASGNA
jgi:hypothetical protein